MKHMNQHQWSALAQEMDHEALLSLTGGGGGTTPTATLSPHDLVSPEPDCDCRPYDPCDVIEFDDNGSNEQD